MNKMTNRLSILFVLTILLTSVRAQVNLVGNPDLETKIDCSIGAFQLHKAKNWCSIDSTQIGCGGFYYNSCSTNIGATTTPKNTYSFQYPRSGNAYIMSQIFCISPSCTGPYYRQYMKNRLVSNLNPGTVYCAKMYVNLVNTCQYGIDAIQMYFGDSSIDTIQTCGGTLYYLIPQVSNPVGNVIGDTLNWIEVSGTFTATGNEKYLVIGCFTPDAVVTKTVANSSWPLWAGYKVLTKTLTWATALSLVFHQKLASNVFGQVEVLPLVLVAGFGLNRQVPEHILMSLHKTFAVI
jgi:hypothetical protein